MCRRFSAGGRRGRSASDSTEGRRGAGQYIEIFEPAGPQLLHLDVSHRAQRRARWPACGLHQPTSGGVVASGSRLRGEGVRNEGFGIQFRGRLTNALPRLSFSTALAGLRANRKEPISFLLADRILPNRKSGA